jgi:hypothetical protein
LPLWSQGGPGNRDPGAVARRNQVEVASQEVGVHGPHPCRAHPVRGGSGGARCRLRRLWGVWRRLPDDHRCSDHQRCWYPWERDRGGHRQLAFSPATLKVKLGQQVTWTNQQQGVTHTVTADGGTFDHPMLSGATFSFTFDKAGSFAYHCKIHPSMHGTIVAS